MDDYAMEAPPVQRFLNSRVQQFVQHEDLSLLAEPVAFENDVDKFTSLLRCAAWGAAISSFGVAPLIAPIWCCRPQELADRYELSMDLDSVYWKSAVNDCCLHIAGQAKTIPLDRVQDVQLNENCLLSCFGLKQLRIETAGNSGDSGPEVCAMHLRNPEEAKNAIALAARLRRMGQASGIVLPLMRGSMANPPPPPYPGAPSVLTPGGGLGARLAELRALVQDGTLTEEQANNVRVAVLSAEKDTALHHLREARVLFDMGAIEEKEFAAIKMKLLDRMANA